jgi:hypothetical protein
MAPGRWRAVTVEVYGVVMEEEAMGEAEAMGGEAMDGEEMEEAGGMGGEAMDGEAMEEAEAMDGEAMAVAAAAAMEAEEEPVEMQFGEDGAQARIHTNTVHS